VLINNAFAGEPLASYSYKNAIDVYAKDFENNVLPTLQITKAALGIFKKQKSGKVITILTSFIHGTPPTGSSSYVATKSYLRSMAKSWASECIKFNVSSNTISPSFMQTQFTADVDSRIIESMEKEHPLKEILPVSEVVKAVKYLSEASSHVNGIDLLINAGASLS
jgi:NAD(P)-dependent dehydrogenase (short-subunit alcohol dehydrogenase family)